jgi:hypothetical protein
MRIFLTISIWLLWLNCCKAQQFSVLYDHNSFANDGSTIIKTTTGYICTHSAIDIESLRFSTFISNHNNLSSLLTDLSLGDQNNIFSLSEPNFGIVYNSDLELYYVFGNHQVDDSDFNKPFILRLNESSEIIDTVYITALNEHNLHTQGGCIASDYLYLLGQLNNSTQTFLIKCDLDGNYLSHTISSIGFISDPKFIVNEGDGFLIGGTYFPVDHPNAVQWQYIRKFSYDGQLLWTNIIENFESTALPSMGAVNAMPMDNGNILFAGTATSGQLLQECFRPMIGEIDNLSGDTLSYHAQL